MGNMSEGSKPNTNGLHESVKGYVGISGKGRKKRTHISARRHGASMWQCYNVMSHICFQAVICFRLEQIGLAKGPKWQTEFFLLASSSGLHGSRLYWCPTPAMNHSSWYSHHCITTSLKSAPLTCFNRVEVGLRQFGPEPEEGLAVFALCSW